MNIHISEFAPIAENITSNEVLNATIIEKTDDGYLLDIKGIAVLAKTDLQLQEGEQLKIKVHYSSPSKLILRTLASPKGVKSSHSISSDQKRSTNNPPEAHLVVKALAKLNLPMTPSRIELWSNLLKKVLRGSEHPTPADQDKSLPLEPESLYDLFLKVTDGYEEDWESHLVSKYLMPLLDKNKSPAGLNFPIEAKSRIIEEYLTSKLITLSTDKDEDQQLLFFPLPLPFYNPGFLKIESRLAETDKDPQVTLSLFIKTHHLGKVKLLLKYRGGTTNGQIIFDRKASLDLAKKALSDTNSRFLKSLRLKRENISLERFLIGHHLKSDIESFDARV